MRDDRERVGDILEAIAGIERLIGNKSLHEFKADIDRLPGVYFYFVVIGEAASAISDDFKAKYADVQWNRISGMRNLLVHVYHRIDPEIVWKTATQDLKPLANRIQEILNDLNR
jgi:uncharacterized protein with HEPN domain